MDISKLEKENLALREQLALLRSELEQIQASSHADDENFRLVMQHSADAILLTIPDGTILYANKEASELLGMTEAEIRAAGRFGLVDINDPRLPELIRERELKGRAKGNVRMLKKNGVVFEADVSTAIFRTTSGEPRASIIFRDVTEADITGRKLRESEVKFRQLLDSAAEGIYGLDKDGRCTFCNVSALKMLGYFEEDEVLGKDMHNLIHHSYENGEPFPASECMIFKAFKSGEPVHVVDEVLWRKDGSLFQAEYWSHPIVNNDMVEGAVVTFLDISERKQHEETIRREKNKFENIVEASPGVVCMIERTPDERFIVRYASSQSDSILGFSLHQLSKDGALWLNNIHPDDYKRVMKEGSDSAQRLSSWNTQYRYNHPLRGQIWLETRLQAERESGGRVIWYGYIIDIAREKQNELREQVLYRIGQATLATNDFRELIDTIRTELSRIIDAKNFYIALYDDQDDALHIPYENEEIDNIEYWPAEKSATGLVIRQKQSVLLKKTDILKLMEQGVLEQIGYMCEVWLGVPMFSGEKVIGAIVVQDYQNPEAYNESSKDFLEFASNQISMVIQRRQFVADLLLAKEKAEESDRLKTAFLANVSHEIRTPMNAIIGFLDLLKKPDLDKQKQLEFIDIVNRSAGRLLDTINDIIEIAKIESRQSDVYISEVNLEELFTYFDTMFRPQAEDRGLLLKPPGKLSLPSNIVKTDQKKLEGILTNLIKNAIKFTKEGEVRFGVKLKGEHLEFFVSDTGIGIPENRIDSVFERFVQADMEMSRGYEGSGLGLAIAKANVEALGGDIWVDSKERRGSHFFFTLPYNAAKALPERAKEPEGELHGHGRAAKTILVAEDDDHSYELIEIILHDDTLNILRAVDGHDAVQAVKDHPDIAMVLMDLKMPGMNGLEATKLIRKMRPDLPIIAQTAHAMASDKELVLGAGCNDYITKPLNHIELKRLVNHYLFVGM